MFKSSLFSAEKSLLCEQLAGVGPRVAERLLRIGIVSVEDLLFHLPLRYENRTKVKFIKNIVVGENCVIDAVIENLFFPQHGKTKLLLRVRDVTGVIVLRFLHLSIYQKRLFRMGARIRCFGEARIATYGLELIHPEYQIILSDSASSLAEKYLTPIYPSTKGLSQLMLRKLTQQALVLLKNKIILQELLPKELLQEMNFLSLTESIFCVHFPTTDVSIKQLNQCRHIAQQRLIFEELLAHRLALLQIKKIFQQQCATVLLNSNKLIKQFVTGLPFELTAAQKKVFREIQQDLSASRPMLRLVQGDVGSGKTVVAALTILQAIDNGGQVALLAPTELLAEQHVKTLRNWFEPLEIEVALLTGSTKAKIKREILSDIKKNKVSLLVGTHAIFQVGVEFSKLVLLIIDEQHRFGVQQRAMLREKGVCGEIFPHQLIMTATPIPRTLAMSFYADFDCSLIDELPPGRSSILTRVLPVERRKEIFLHLNNACEAGSQAYWVCALIEDSEALQCQAAENTFQQLVAALPKFKVGLLTGRMKSIEKDQVMSEFRAGELQILVATTVIEVGVDVPAANLMIIENAERFGLAQLHQLRGRVGRGSAKSCCLLLYKSPLSKLAHERLAVMRQTTDGFKIAERDLELRGAGEILGTRQVGDVSLRLADVLRDSYLFPKIQLAAKLILEKYPMLVELLTDRWIGDAKKYGQV